MIINCLSGHKCHNNIEICSSIMNMAHSIKLYYAIISIHIKIIYDYKDVFHDSYARSIYWQYVV